MVFSPIVHLYSLVHRIVMSLQRTFGERSSTAKHELVFGYLSGVTGASNSIGVLSNTIQRISYDQITLVGNASQTI
jgi:hypothetical protein